MSSKIQALRNLRYWKTPLFLLAKLCFPTKMHFEPLSFFSYRWRWLQIWLLAFCSASPLWWSGWCVINVCSGKICGWNRIRGSQLFLRAMPQVVYIRDQPYGRIHVIKIGTSLRTVSVHFSQQNLIPCCN